MRGTGFGPYRSATIWLLILNTVIFVAWSLLERYAPSFEQIAPYFKLSPQGLANGYVWQLVTYQFLHANLLHLLFNMLAIYVFGRPLEEALGKGVFLRLYFLSGILGGLLQCVLGWQFQRYFGGPVMGASAGAFGLVAAYATLYPEQPLTVLLAFIIPVTMRAKYLVYFGGALAVFGILVPSEHVAHAAHLGGLLTGIAYIRWGIKAEGRWFTWRSWRRATRPRELVNASVIRRTGWQSRKNVPSDDAETADFISREVDPILDKISAHGIHSLTLRERQILEAARRKMARR